MIRSPLKLQAPQVWSWEQAAHTWMPSPEALHTALDEALWFEPEGLRGLLQGLGAPVLDMLTTPLATRAALLGAERGGAFFHHEARRRLAMPPELAPEVQVWDQGTVPTWERGVLCEPKYFSFFQDAPLPAYHPNHRRKWRPHELLHIAQGFFWSPEMTRHAFYLGARVNELLPVVHWYGLSEAWRPRCPLHSGPTAQTCPACEARAVPWWEHSESWRRQHSQAALGWLRSAQRHMDQQWAACLQELSSGQRVERRWQHLDDSSDAVGYLRGHWNRVTSYSFGAWVEIFLEPGEDYFTSLEPAFARAAQVARRLTSGDLQVSRQQAAWRRARRALQDMGYRLLLALEWLEQSATSVQARRAGQACQPALELASQAAQQLLRDDPALAHDAFAALELAAQILDPMLPQEQQGALAATGYLWEDLEPLTGLTRQQQAEASTDLLIEGLSEVAPMTLEQVEPEVHELVQSLCLGAAFQGHGPLVQRLARHIAQEQGSSSPLAQIASLEAATHAGPWRDADAEDFATLPEELEELQGPGELRLHRTLRLVSLSGEMAAQVLEQPELQEDEAVTLALIQHRGEARMLMVSPDIQAFLQTTGLKRQEWLALLDPESTQVLLEEGFLVWNPAPTSSRLLGGDGA